MENAEDIRMTLDLAYKWQPGSMVDLLKARPWVVLPALRRMRENAAHYLAEMTALIESGDFSEVAHHSGHVESEMKGIETLLCALSAAPQVSTEEVAQKDSAPLPGAPDAGTDSWAEKPQKAGRSPLAPDSPGDGGGVKPPSAAKLVPGEPYPGTCPRCWHVIADMPAECGCECHGYLVIGGQKER